MISLLRKMIATKADKGSHDGFVVPIVVAIARDFELEEIERRELIPCQFLR